LAARAGDARPGQDRSDPRRHRRPIQLLPEVVTYRNVEPLLARDSEAEPDKVGPRHEARRRLSVEPDHRIRPGLSPLEEPHHRRERLLIVHDEAAEPRLGRDLDHDDGGKCSIGTMPTPSNSTARFWMTSQ